MTIQEAVEKCMGYQNNELNVVFYIYDETEGEIPGLFYTAHTFDDLVVHMFSLDIHNYSVNGILKGAQRYNVFEGCHQPILIGVKNDTRRG